jgi:hypothetical protein
MPPAAVLVCGLVVPVCAAAQALDPPAGPHPPRVAGVARAADSRLPIPSNELTDVADEQAPTACAGCPAKRRDRPYLESLALNVMYNGINHLRGHHTARVGLNSWGANLKHGFEWDVNSWLVNQVGHPIQGSQYGRGRWHRAGRRGLSAGTGRGGGRRAGSRLIGRRTYDYGPGVRLLPPRGPDDLR